MRKLTSQSGLTITELLVASMVVGIVATGALSIEYALRQSERGLRNQTLSSMSAGAAMIYLSRDAMQTVGDITDDGLEFDDDGPERNICFRYDADTNPNNYTGDLYNCYSHTNANPNLVFRCTAQAVPLAADDACPGNNQIVQLTQPDFFEVVEDGFGRLSYIQIDINTRDATAAADNVQNPIVNLRSRINPPGVSR